MSNAELIEKLRGQIEAIESEGGAFSGEMPEGAVAETGKEPLCVRDDRSKRPSSGSFDDAFSKIVALVNVSDRSEKTIRERLERAEFEQAAIDEAVDRAKSYGFIDDMRFGSTLVRSRLAQGKGVVGIGRELKSHGIEIDAVPGWPDEFGVGESSEFDRALGLLKRKPPRSKNLRDGAYRKLIGKGFSSSVASSASRAWFESL